MAGGKLSARQKMINLMYLVFIAMIAMTIDKEVLSAFASMDSKFDSTKAFTARANDILLKGLDQKQWQITNVVKLRVAGMEDASL